MSYHYNSKQNFLKGTKGKRDVKKKVSCLTVSVNNYAVFEKKHEVVYNLLGMTGVITPS